MSKIEWTSEEEKWIAIGYLARRGTISSIEATVPRGKTREFQVKFRGKYDPNYPYEANKYGRQFRIYLNNTEDCPSFLYNQLDDQYKNRINDTEFIEELVLNYGFRFSNRPQLLFEIDQSVKKKGKVVYAYFCRGLRARYDFIYTLKKKIETGDLASALIVKDCSSIEPHKVSKKGSTTSIDEKMDLPEQYLMNLGWLGEAYVYNLLLNRCDNVYNCLGIPVESVSDVVWFNQGFQTSTHRSYWKDQSVGHGCDLQIRTINGLYYIEVKASKRLYPVFTMTATEIQKMAEAENRYYLVKINYLERILCNDSPEICIYKDPFAYFFNTKQIKEAKFYLE